MRCVLAQGATTHIQGLDKVQEISLQVSHPDNHPAREKINLKVKKNEETVKIRANKGQLEGESGWREGGDLRVGSRHLMQSQCGHAVILRSTRGWGGGGGRPGFIGDDLLGSTVTLGSTGLIGDEDPLTLQETCCPDL